jgi:hypothetical protein
MHDCIDRSGWRKLRSELCQQCGVKCLTLTPDHFGRHDFRTLPLRIQELCELSRRKFRCAGERIGCEWSLRQIDSDATDEQVGFSGLELYDPGDVVAVNFLRARKLNGGYHAAGNKARNKLLLDCLRLRGAR